MFGFDWKSSVILGNFWENSCGLRTVFVESLQIFGKWSKIFRKSSKTSLSVCLYDKQNNILLLVDMEYPFSLTREISQEILHIYVRSWPMYYLLCSYGLFPVEVYTD